MAASGVRSGTAGSSPEIDVGLGRVAVDLGELVLGEVELLQRGDVGLQLLHAGGADECRRHSRVAERPRQRQLRQRLAAAGRDLVQRLDLGEGLLVDQAR